jgi:nickel and cobalt resistance protein CnrR
MRRLLPWALLAASLAANVVLGMTLAHRGGSALPGEPLIFSRVQLDADQRARISSLRSELLARRQENQRTLMQLRRQLAEAIGHDPEDRAAVDATLRQIAGSQARFQAAVVDHVLAVRAVLRPDQRPAFEDIIAGHMQQAGGQMRCGLESPGEMTRP